MARPIVPCAGAEDDFLNKHQDALERCRRVPAADQLPDGRYEAVPVLVGIKPYKAGLHLWIKLIVASPMKYRGAEIFSHTYIPEPKLSMKKLHVLYSHLGLELTHISELRDLQSTIKGWLLGVDLYQAPPFTNVAITDRIELEDADGSAGCDDDGDELNAEAWSDDEDEDEEYQ